MVAVNAGKNRAFKNLVQMLFPGLILRDSYSLGRLGVVSLVRFKKLCSIFNTVAAFI